MRYLLAMIGATNCLKGPVLFFYFRTLVYSGYIDDIECVTWEITVKVNNWKYVGSYKYGNTFAKRKLRGVR